jgi:redox-sensitive bicupin YhaK (pirin superfamily)
MQKKIEHILSGREKKITEDETVWQSLPHKDFRFANPIIVVHHGGPETIQPGSHARIQPHPHRGFSPYTFMLQGEGFHRDNAGNDEVIRAGGVQWMFAGKGILHSEGPTADMQKKGGQYEMIQLWINAPKANKSDKPFYQAAGKEQLPRVMVQEGVNFRLASGDYEGQTGPIRNFTPLVSIIGEVRSGKTVRFTATPGYWTLLYVIKGTIVVNNTDRIGKHNLVVFEKEDDNFTVSTTEDAQLLYLSAEPLDEPVAAKDNYVMNTPEEIDQAMADYQQGAFGSLSY